MRRIRLSGLLILLTLLLMFPRPGRACSVPVFRYALERWASDPYRVILFHKGPLTTEQQKLADAIAPDRNAAPGLPAFLKTVDVSKPIPKNFVQIWEAEKSKPLPRIALFYPKHYGMDLPVWSAPLTSETLAQARHSPLRHRLIRRLLQGETAVWLFLPGGNPKEDQAARRTLEDGLAKLKEELKLPHQLDENDTTYDSPVAEGVELKIAFSILDVDPKDPKESFLLASLLQVDETLTKNPGPLIIPVFGRGRALTVLQGESIAAKTIEEIGWFLVGPCSCRVKMQNPGWDLLLAVDWDEIIQGIVELDEVLPPLAGPVDAFAAALPALPAETTPPSQSQQPIRLALFLGLGGVGVLVLVWYLSTARHK